MKLIFAFFLTVTLLSLPSFTQAHAEEYSCLTKVNVDFSKRIKDLTDEEVAVIQKEITANYRVEGELRKEITLNIKRLQEIGSYRGSRHKRGLPARGQRTKTNARTRKGPRKQPVALKRKVTKK